MIEEHKALVSLIRESYKDIAQPTARVIGDALGQCAGFVLEPVGGLANIGRNNLMRFVKKLEKEERENPENIIPTKPSVAVPILEKMRYVEEDVLANAYAELLKNSCLKDQQVKVLPAYSEILARLSPDEVKILDFVYREKNSYEIPALELLKLASDKEKKNLAGTTVPAEMHVSYPLRGIPFLEVRSAVRKEGDSWTVMVKYFTDVSEKIALSSPEDIEVYIENLQSLGIFQVRTNFWFTPTAIYNDLEIDATRQYKEMIERAGCVMELLKGEIRLTSLAESFLAMCASNRHNGESNAHPS